MRSGCWMIPASTLRSRRVGASRGLITLAFRSRTRPSCTRSMPGVIEQGQTSCCYAKSEKSWIDDPSGISWETFLTTGESIDYGDGTGEREARVAHEKSCCAPGATTGHAASACCGSNDYA